MCPALVVLLQMDSGGPLGAAWKQEVESEQPCPHSVVQSVFTYSLTSILRFHLCQLNQAQVKGVQDPRAIG